MKREEEVKTMGRLSRFVGVSVIGILLAAFMGGPANGADGNVIELTYGTPYGPDHTFSRTDQKWFAKIEKETQGRVKFKPYWGGSLIGGRAEAIDEVAKGVVDVGFISPGQARTGYDLAKANFLFFTGARQGEGYKIFRQVLDKFPEIEAEYKGLKVMGWSSGTQYDLLTRKPVRRLDDVKGMRVKTLGEIVDVLKELGVEGLSSPMSEVYMSMQKGVLDGAFVTYSTLKVLRFAEVAKHYTMINLYRPHTGSRVMGRTTWDRLPPDIQKVFQNNVEWFSLEADGDVMRDDAEGKEFGQKNGVEFISLPQEDLDRFYGLIRKDAVKEAQRLDAKGLPASRIFEEAQRLVKASK